MTRDDRVRRFGSIGIAICVLILLGTVAYSFVQGRLGKTPSARGYAVGDRIDVPETIYSAAPHTLLIFARSSCGVCQRDFPALKRIVATYASSPGLGVAMIGARSDQEADREFARALGVADDALSLLDLARLRVAVVPALVVVNRTGTVVFAHSGAASPTAEKTLARVVLSLGPDR